MLFDVEIINFNKFYFSCSVPVTAVTVFNMNSAILSITYLFSMDSFQKDASLPSLPSLNNA